MGDLYQDVDQGLGGPGVIIAGRQTQTGLDTELAGKSWNSTGKIGRIGRHLAEKPNVKVTMCFGPMRPISPVEFQLKPGKDSPAVNESWLYIYSVITFLLLN